MIDESINLDEPISDIVVLVNSVTNAGENWELDSDSSIGHLSSFISVRCLSQRCPYYMNDLCKAGSEMTDQYCVWACPIPFCRQFNVD